MTVKQALFNYLIESIEVIKKARKEMREKYPLLLTSHSRRNKKDKGEK